MRQLSILGIDAAWTPTQPSGVALVSREKGTWECSALGSSYRDFLDTSLEHPVVVNGRIDKSERVPVEEILNHAKELLGGMDVDVVAVDMPLSPSLITSRRVCDNAVSRAFGKQKCSTHSPTKERPGEVSLHLVRKLRTCGYRLDTGEGVPDGSRTVIEVYPHPAIVRLLHLEERLRYKVSKSSKYWHGTSLALRKQKLLDNFRSLLHGLDSKISCIRLCIPQQSETLSGLKPIEDALDALVCAWVAATYCDNCAEAFGDESGVIWIPKPLMNVENDPLASSI